MPADSPKLLLLQCKVRCTRKKKEGDPAQVWDKSSIVLGFSKELMIQKMIVDLSKWHLQWYTWGGVQVGR